MMIEPEIFDWPRQAVIDSGIFFAGGQVRRGGFTTGGAMISHPEPGGMSYFEGTLGNMGECAGAIGSWLMSAIMDGRIFRVPIYRSPQLVEASALGIKIPESYETTGMPWSDGLLWEGDVGWAFDPAAIATAAGLEGSTLLKIDLGGLHPGLMHGHLVGHKDRTYKIMNISYVGPVATIRVAPPLRKDVAIGDRITFRPKMLATVADPDQTRGTFRHHRNLLLGSVRFLEARP